MGSNGLPIGVTRDRQDFLARIYVEKPIYCGRHKTVIEAIEAQAQKFREFRNSYTPAFRRGIWSDLTGLRFGELLVLKRAKENKNWGGNCWVCECSCGNTVEVTAEALVRGRCDACGHHKVEVLKTYGVQRRKQQFGTNHDLLTDIPYSNNTSGYRNIHVNKTKSGELRYRAVIAYKGVTYYGHLESRVEDAIVERDQLRNKYWPQGKWVQTD